MDDRAAARADDERFRALVEHAPDGIVISRRGVIFYVNPAAVVMLGYDDESELVGKPMAIFLDEGAIATMRERLAHMQQTGERLGPMEYAARRRDGSPLTAEIASMLIQFDGQPSVLAYARDVTERVRLRARLEHQDRLAALGLMAAGVAHEINNPLAFMSLAVDLLERRAAESSGDAESTLLREVRNGIERIAAIARDLRVYGRQDEERIRAVSITEVLDAAERMVAHELRPRVRLLREDGELPLVNGVARRLEQVFVNLLLNAALAFECEADPTAVGPAGAAYHPRRDDAQIVVTSEVRAREVEIIVRDNGSGMTPEVLARIFEPFFTTRPQGGGTGLGLSICRDIVLVLGGELVAESRPGHGTTMRVRLPRAVPRDVRTPKPEVPVRASRPDARPRVLVIDDEPIVVDLVTQVLAADCDVVGETSSSEGLRRVLADSSFDVVVCDLMMPGLSGMDVYARIARERPGVEQRVLFITGGAYTPQTRDFLERVPNTRLLKPFLPAELRSAIEQLSTPR